MIDTRECAGCKLLYPILRMNWVKAMLSNGKFEAGVTTQDVEQTIIGLRLNFLHTLETDIDNGHAGGEHWYCDECYKNLQIFTVVEPPSKECQCKTCKSIRFDLSVHEDALAHMWADGVGSNHVPQVNHHEERISLLKRLLGD